MLLLFTQKKLFMRFSNNSSDEEQVPKVSVHYHRPFRDPIKLFFLYCIALDRFALAATKFFFTIHMYVQKGTMLHSIHFLNCMLLGEK